MVAMLWSIGRIAHGAFVSVQSTQGDAGRGDLIREILTVCRTVPAAVTNDEQLVCNGADRHGVSAGESTQQYLQRERIRSHHGDPWSHGASSFAQLQHETNTPPAFLLSIAGETDER